MFGNNSHNDDTKTDMDHVAKDIESSAPQMGIGTNPTSFNPVMPTPPSPSSSPMSDDTVDTPTEEPKDNSSAPVVPSSSSGVPADLNSIKEEALKQLSPLVHKLDQDPEERFKTLMMMIQAADNHDLIKDAYEAANKIEDETAKAQALLSIVNEINYFTQKSA